MRTLVILGNQSKNKMYVRTLISTRMASICDQVIASGYNGEAEFISSLFIYKEDGFVETESKAYDTFTNFEYSLGMSDNKIVYVGTDSEHMWRAITLAKIVNYLAYDNYFIIRPIVVKEYPKQWERLLRNLWNHRKDLWRMI